MAALFDERVETAIQILWFDIHSGRAKEALALLREAANMGDGDAFYFLGCCYMGKIISIQLLVLMKTKHLHMNASI